MATVSLTFDSSREEAAASTVPEGEFDRIITDYLATITRKQMNDAFDKASAEDKESILRVAEAIQAAAIAAVDPL